MAKTFGGATWPHNHKLLKPKWPKLSVKFLNFDFHGVEFGHYAHCDAIYTCFLIFWSLGKKRKKIRENCSENVVSDTYKKN